MDRKLVRNFLHTSDFVNLTIILEKWSSEKMKFITGTDDIPIKDLVEFIYTWFGAPLNLIGKTDDFQ